MPEYRDAVIKRHAQLLAEIGKFTGLKNGKKVLDLGCGNGAGTIYLASQGVDITGIDNNQPGEDDIRAAIASGAENKSAAVFREMDAQHMDFGGQTFDAILMIDVMEHLLSPQKALAEAKRVLKPQGELIIVWQPYYSPFGGHLRFYSKNPWRQLIPFFNAEKFLKKACQKNPINSYEHEIAVFKSLNKLTLRKFRRIVKNLSLKTKVLQRVPFNLENTVTGLKAERRARGILNKMPLLPLIEEFTTQSVLIILKKT